MVRVVLSGFAASEVEVRAEAGADLDDENVATVLRAWDGEALVFSVLDLSAIVDGLCVLSNACEEEARLVRTGPLDGEERRALTHASRGLSTATRRVRAAATGRTSRRLR